MEKAGDDGGQEQQAAHFARLRARAHRHPAQAPRLVAEALQQMYVRRPRPVALEMPWDVFGRQGPSRACVHAGPYMQLEADPEATEQAARMLREAGNPMIMVGSGAMHA